ncbi:MAG: hypothetical protein JKX81_10590 [Arenicella sp.]|nr:hypothetical protein [Arenicella sp.]
MAGSNYKKRHQLVKAQVDAEVGRSLGVWGQTKSFFGGSETYSDKRKAAIDKHYDSFVQQKFISARRNELSAMHAKSGAVVAGRPQAIRELSTGAKNAMEYATGLHADSRKKRENDLSDQTFNNLRVGSETMDHIRQKLNKGRGNVDANDPNFPEAHYRTRVGYKNFGKDFSQHAAVAELMRAGNCDMHAASTYTHTSAHMDRETVAAKVVHGGAKHTFSELRGSQGHTTTEASDVIVDSWATEKHAVLRADSEFGAGISSSKDRNADKNFTQATMSLGAGKQALQRQRSIVNASTAFQTHHDAEALKPVNRPNIVHDQYGATPMMSDSGVASMERRAKVLESGRGNSLKPLGNLLPSLQRVEVARKMGASIGGAAKYADSKVAVAQPKPSYSTRIGRFLGLIS